MLDSLEYCFSELCHYFSRSKVVAAKISFSTRKRGQGQTIIYDDNNRDTRIR